MPKHTILFLAANPLGTSRIALDEEARTIQDELERSGHRGTFELVTRWAARPLDLLRELRKLQPTVVHFSGHGASDPDGRASRSAPRDVTLEAGAVSDDHPHGLFFQGPDGSPQLVSTAALEATFGAAGGSVQVVVLNACYSEAPASALLAHVDCIVGMRGSISDEAPKNFAVGFYGGLGNRRSIGEAYKHGRAAIALAGLAEQEHPQLRVRAPVDADGLLLAAAGTGDQARIVRGSIAALVLTILAGFVALPVFHEDAHGRSPHGAAIIADAVIVPPTAPVRGDPRRHGRSVTTHGKRTVVSTVAHRAV